MTMKRTEKASHRDILESVSSLTGTVPVEFSGPRRAGRSKMTEAEYRDLKMGRGHRDAETAREIKGSKVRYRWSERAW